MAALIVFVLSILPLWQGSFQRKVSLTREEIFLARQAFVPFIFSGLRRIERRNSLARYILPEIK